MICVEKKMKKTTPYSRRGDNLVFIVGCPRSGTTWLQKLLACHPKIHTGQESDIFDGYIGPQLRYWRKYSKPYVDGRPALGLACYLTETEFIQVLKEYMHKLFDPMIGKLKQGEIFLEKTPSHALFIPEITELLPDAKVIHMLRDARAVVASLLAASKSWGKNWAPRYAFLAARMWVKHVSAVRQSVKDQVLSKELFYEVRYENLHGSTIEVVKGAIDFLCLDWSENEIKDAVEKNKPENAKLGLGTNIPVGGEFAKMSLPAFEEPQGFVRKAEKSAWKYDLSWIQKLFIWIIAKKCMREVGYSWEFSRS